MPSEIVNKEKAKKRRGNPSWIKGGKSPNPAGRGPDDSSMRAAYEWALSLTPDVVAEILSINGSNDLARQFKQMPRGVQLKLLVALRVVSALMFEPQAAMMNHVVDRLDGPVKSQIEQINWDVSQLNDEQLARLADGDDIRSIIATSSASRTGTPQANQNAAGDTQS